MSNKRKKIAIFGNCFTSRYRCSFPKAFNIVSEELNMDLYYFNFLGKIGNKNTQYGDYEFELLEHIDLAQFDGIIFDGEGYNVEGMANKVIRKLQQAPCPVVSISSFVDGFYNIEFDDAGGLRTIVEHFINHHHFTKIGFMSGYLSHPDARARLAEFRAVMQEHGLPADGVGMFEGDFWFHKGGEAADFFLSLPDRPEAIVCANDYMAIALSTALKARNIRIPDDITISGYDGTLEGQEYLPHITSVTRERIQIARKSLTLLKELAENGNAEHLDLRITPHPIYTQSCGCESLDYRHEAENINRVSDVNRSLSFSMYDMESSILKLNKVENVRQIEKIFDETPVNFGDYTAFFTMVHTDSKDRPAYDSDFTSPTGNFVTAVWIDKNKEYTASQRRFNRMEIVPQSNSDRCHFYYIMSVHCAERSFGYSVIEMAGKDIFNEFYNVWLLNLAITLEKLFKNDRINKLIDKLKNLSIKDGLTGMLNRRGFEDHSRNIIASLREKKTICTMVIDMDGLKHINDVYGHYEGDRVIKASADIIMRCCDSGEIAGRAGGDEFYIFAVDYTEMRLERFIKRMKEFIKEYNDNNDRPYTFDLSYGTYMTETDSYGQLEEFVKISDARMYEQKQSKPNRHKRGAEAAPQMI